MPDWYISGIIKTMFTDGKKGKWVYSLYKINRKIGYFCLLGLLFVSGKSVVVYFFDLRMNSMAGRVFELIAQVPFMDLYLVWCSLIL